MSTTGSDEERVRRGSLDEGLSTRLTRGVVDGFTEASQAFSHELEGTSRFPELMGRSVAAVIRANARLLDEVADAVRAAAVEWGERHVQALDEGFDYDHLADLIAARLKDKA